MFKQLKQRKQNAAQMLDTSHKAEHQTQDRTITESCYILAFTGMLHVFLICIKIRFAGRRKIVRRDGRTPFRTSENTSFKEKL